MATTGGALIVGDFLQAAHDVTLTLDFEAATMAASHHSTMCGVAIFPATARVGSTAMISSFSGNNGYDEPQRQLPLHPSGDGVPFKARRVFQPTTPIHRLAVDRHRSSSAFPVSPILHTRRDLELIVHLGFFAAPFPIRRTHRDYIFGI
ncbi:hypothetical protein M6B38_113220 [Iris pallida]|uniref:Uncharacterized protein n=1 Tax=Iris pallida TaxID=29817 RepID=A0AAX6ILB3_IRIPA|nr:hypothetical protein M6B38_113220 [Iris pallida]